MDKRICSVEGCDREAPVEWCTGHQQRVRRTGSPGPAQFRRSPGTPPPWCRVEVCDRPAETGDGLCRSHAVRQQKGQALDTPIAKRDGSEPPRCSIDGCDGPAFGRGWCSRHYQRWHRTGDPGPADIPRYGLIETCTADGCDRAHRTKGYCDTHYRRWVRGWPTDSLRFLVIKERAKVMTYEAAHGRIRALRGRAADCMCLCGAPAHAWAYQHNDPEALADPAGHPYSLRFFDCYEPMCRSCHALLDRNLDERMARGRID